LTTRAGHVSAMIRKPVATAEELAIIVVERK
jgi:hypothetical protein